MNARLVWLVGVLVPAVSFAQVCSMDQLNLDLQLFRRWSIDLRGRPPSFAELDALVAHGGLAGTELDTLLASADFKSVMRERLRADVYAALDLNYENGFSLERTGAVFGDSREVFWNRLRTTRGLFGGCDINREQTAFTAAGVPIPDAQGVDGWVWVTPYWAPQFPIKVCSFEAQPHLVGPVSGVDCSTLAGVGVQDCGCGPNLKFCQLTVGYASAVLDAQGPLEPIPGVKIRGAVHDPTAVVLDRSFVEQTLRFADRIVDEQRPWSDLLLSDETEVNGPIAHYLREQTRTAIDSNFSSRPDLGYAVPTSLQFSDTDTWVRVRSTSNKAAGVLTQPMYLAKFATNRARANRFYNAFLCSAFQAPPGGLPSSTEPCAQEPNLTQRCGCDSCHKTLEPMAAYWGRFSERGLHELKEPEFPTFKAECAGDAGVSAHCFTYYATSAQTLGDPTALGKLKAFRHAAGFEDHIDEGPRALAMKHVMNGDFARCTVRKEFERLVGRPFAEQLADERALLDSLSGEFQGSNHDIRTLVRSIMTSPQYRNVGGVP